MKTQHKKKVQYDIQDAGQNQEKERQRGIADSAQDSASHVVDQKPRYAGQIDRQVDSGIRKYVFGSQHEREHGPDPEDAENGEQHAEKKGHGHRCFNRAVKLFRIFRAETAADYDAGPDRETIKEEDDNVDDHRSGAHGGKRLLADKVTDYDGIDGVVEHLENIAQHQGNGKKEKLLYDGAFCHIPCVSGTPADRNHVMSSYGFRGNEPSYACACPAAAAG